MAELKKEEAKKELEGILEKEKSTCSIQYYRRKISGVENSDRVIVLQL